MQQSLSNTKKTQQQSETMVTEGISPITTYSLSVVLPAHNEEAAIGRTVAQVLDALTLWVKDFEIVVVNDGSVDRTALILDQLAQADPHVRVITHPVNQGYGAALISGFNAVQKELAFFMDSDGQFDIHDVQQFFPFIEQYDAVLGYRMDRRDPWIRKLNAWGWKQVIGLVLGVRVRDLDCAFKLYKADFLQRHQFETRGAMINAEMLYRLKHDGCTFKEVGVHHLPRYGGQATGANPAVILRAFKELFYYARKWRYER
jgi:glycosyltransferase involved in cell wall biosynthesis